MGSAFNGGATPIYVVVALGATDPRGANVGGWEGAGGGRGAILGKGGATDPRGANVSGWNGAVGGRATIWVKGDAPDRYSDILSHELAEIKTDYNGGGVEVSPGASDENQIGDGEGVGYGYRLNSGILVQ